MQEDRVLIALNATSGFAALAGMRFALGGAPGVPVDWLDGTPFPDYRVAGLILRCVYAPVSLAAAWALWRRAAHAGELAMAAVGVADLVLASGARR